MDGGARKGAGPGRGEAAPVSLAGLGDEDVVEEGEALGEPRFGLVRGLVGEGEPEEGLHAMARHAVEEAKFCNIILALITSNRFKNI